MVRIPFFLIVAAGFVVAAIVFPPGRAAFIPLSGTCVILWWAASAVAREREENNRLRRDGLPGVARIRSLFQPSVQPKSGGYLNVVLELDIVTGEATRRVHRGERVPLLHVARLAVDVKLPVRVDRVDPSKWLILWDEPTD